MGGFAYYFLGWVISLILLFGLGFIWRTKEKYVTIGEIVSIVLFSCLSWVTVVSCLFVLSFLGYEKLKSMDFWNQKIYYQ